MTGYPEGPSRASPERYNRHSPSESFIPEIPADPVTALLTVFMGSFQAYQRFSPPHNRKNQTCGKIRNALRGHWLRGWSGIPFFERTPFFLHGPKAGRPAQLQAVPAPWRILKVSGKRSWLFTQPPVRGEKRLCVSGAEPPSHDPSLRESVCQAESATAHSRTVSC